MDEVPVTPPGGPADNPDGRVDLTALRDRALAGETGVEEYFAACCQVVERYVYRNTRRYLDQSSFEAQDIVQETMARALYRYGRFIDRGRDSGQPVGNVGGLLLTMARNLLIDHYSLSLPEEPPPQSPADSPPRADANTEARKRPVSLDDLLAAGGRGPAQQDSLGYAEEQQLAQAREQARRQLHKLVTRVRGPRACPFHRNSATGCPNGPQVFALIGELIDRDVELAGDRAHERLRDLGRQLGLSSRDNDLRRHLIGCFDWWSYQAFAGTVVDQPRGGGDRIRRPLVGWLTAGLRADGEWVSSACPKRGAQQILATDPAGFERLLARAGRADVYEFLMRRAS